MPIRIIAGMAGSTTREWEGRAYIRGSVSFAKESSSREKISLHEVMEIHR